VLVVILIIATGLFAYGVLHERSLIRNGHGETAAQLANETAATRAGETPAKRASETPATKAIETPAKRASETPAMKATETPAKRASETATNAGTVAATPTGNGETAAQHAREGRVLGVDLESTPMIELAIVAGLGLAIVAFSPLGAMRAILIGLALGTLAWSALDVREVVHQANESRTDLAIVAGVVAGLHAAAAALAVWLARTAPAGTRRRTGRRRPALRRAA
jgi:cobalamin biosynthesis Mg chelatase CobN